MDEANELADAMSPLEAAMGPQAVEPDKAWSTLFDDLTVSQEQDDKAWGAFFSDVTAGQERDDKAWNEFFADVTAGQKKEDLEWNQFFGDVTSGQERDDKAWGEFFADVTREKDDKAWNDFFADVAAGQDRDDKAWGEFFGDVTAGQERDDKAWGEFFGDVTAGQEREDKEWSEFFGSLAEDDPEPIPAISPLTGKEPTPIEDALALVALALTDARMRQSPEPSEGQPKEQRPAWGLRFPQRPDHPDAGLGYSTGASPSFKGSSNRAGVEGAGGVAGPTTFGPRSRADFFETGEKG